MGYTIISVIDSTSIKFLKSSCMQYKITEGFLLNGLKPNLIEWALNEFRK
jgi:hypothetical protein